MNTLEKHFKIRERGSSVRTEVLAGNGKAERGRQIRTCFRTQTKASL